MKDQFQRVDDHFASDDEAFEKYRDKVQENFKSHYKKIRNCDAEIDQIHKTLQHNKVDRDDLHKQCEFLGNKIKESNTKNKAALMDKFTKLTDKNNY